MRGKAAEKASPPEGRAEAGGQLKVGLFCESFLPVIDGVGRVVHAYARVLEEKGHEVTVAAPTYGGARGAGPFRLVDWRSFTVPRARLYRIGVSALDAGYRRRIRTVGMDIVHAHSPFSAGSAARAAARRLKVPLVYTFHSKFSEDFYKATRSRALAKAAERYVGRFMRRCDEVWAVSEGAVKVIREYGFPGPVRVMPNGADLRSPVPGAADAAAERFGLGDLPVLLYAGHLDWKKNLLLILRAASLLRGQGMAFRLVLAGQGKDREAVRRKASELGLGETLLMTGHLTDTALLDGLYQRAALFVFPSLYDTSGMVVREAAVMGTPSVLIRGSDAAEGIRDGYNGFLCENSPESLARVLMDALSDPERLRVIGRSARETIPLPWNAVMDDVLRQYGRIIAEYRAKSR